MTLTDWLRTVAYVLNDDEPTRPFQRYTLHDMIAAYNAAMCLVFKYRPDLFTELRVVQLVPGRHQDLRGCCTNVLDVLEQTDAKGNIIRLLKGARKHVTTAKRLWKKPACLPNLPTGYIIENIDIDANLNGRFAIDPPVPCGAPAYVTVKCVTAPCSFTDADANVELNMACEHTTASWHYVLATMMSGDRFTNAGAAGGDRKYHYDLFFQILGVNQKQEERSESKEQATS